MKKTIVSIITVLSLTIGVFFATETLAANTVANLAVTTISSNSISLSWTAPGDEISGAAPSYDLRYSKSSIDSSNWDAATPVSPQPVPSAPGTAESYTVIGLDHGTTYYFALKSPELSNVTSGATISPHLTPPTIVDFSVLETSTSLSVPILSLSATDDLGLVSGYMVTESSIAPSVNDGGWSISPPTQYTFSSGGTKTLYAWAKDPAGNISASVSRTVTVIVPDNTAPVISGGLPTGTLPAGTTATTISVKTDEESFCRYDTSANKDYYTMAHSFSATSTDHSTVAGNLGNGQSYSYYIRCSDNLGNVNTADYVISFAIASPSSSGGGTGGSNNGGGGGSSGGGSGSSSSSGSSGGNINQTASAYSALLSGVSATSTITLPNIKMNWLSRMPIFGERSDDARKLQQFLADNDYMPQSLTTGYFGSITAAALDAFRNDHKLPADEAMMIVKINSLVSSTSLTANVLSANVFAISTSLNTDVANYDFVRDLRSGMVGDDVKMLQIFLNSYGYIVASVGAGSTGNETNYFGPATKAALIRFQSANDIPSTGYFGLITRTLIASKSFK